MKGKVSILSGSDIYGPNRALDLIGNYAWSPMAWAKYVSRTLKAGATMFHYATAEMEAWAIARRMAGKQ